jgi:hypothetical protein
MFNRNIQWCLSAIVVCSISGFVSAATIQGKLTSVYVGSTGGVSSGILSGTLTGSYDTGTGIFTFDPGTANILFDLNPLPENELYTWSVTDWTIGDGSTSASGYECIDGTFGFSVGANLCAYVSDSIDFTIETTTDYSTIPGTRILGANDVAVGPQQQLSDLAATAVSFDASFGQLVMETAGWTQNGGAEGTQFIFSTVPIPAAAWLFGSALIGLVGLKRKNNNCRMG